MKMSACIIALNEEVYIARAINSLKQLSIVDDIIVVDGGSTDNTVAICESLGCKVFVKKWEQDFSLQRNYALSMCAHDWVVTLDADEWYPESTRNMIESLFKNDMGKYSAIKIHEISEIGCESLDAPPMKPEDIHLYCSEFSPETSIDSYLKFDIDDGRTIALSRTFRVLNRARGRWHGKIHEVFHSDPGFEVFQSPWRYAIHHQKSRNQQSRSESKYYAIDHDATAYYYSQDFDDLEGGRSQKSTQRLDEVFFNLITEVHPCNKFIEAGSFDGRSSRQVQAALPHAEVFAFEANPYNYNQFKSLFDDNSARYIHMAITDRDGDVTFRVQRHNNGHEMPTVKGNDSILMRTEPNVEYENFTLPGTTLDSYFSSSITRDDRIALWVDLEGAAYQALQGAVRILDNVDVIKIEVESYRHWEDQMLDSDVRIFLSHHGFFPVIRDYEISTQYNIMFCKKSIIWTEGFQSLMSRYGYSLNVVG